MQPYNNAMMQMSLSPRQRSDAEHVHAYKIRNNATLSSEKCMSRGLVTAVACDPASKSELLAKFSLLSSSPCTDF